ncbi:MAG: SCO family protein [Myxococcota bacterium]
MMWRRALRVLHLSLLAALVSATPACEEREPPPKLGHVPGFELVAQNGEAFRGEDMEGHVWIVDFIFTSCVTYCPRMTERMKSLRGELEGEGVRYLSVSVDPEHDTPEVLRAYAEKHGATGGDWTFVTGDTAEVSRAVVQGFKTPMGEPVPLDEGDGYDILHARHFLLVDRGRRIRGYYRTDEEGLEQLVEDARHLAGEPSA